jgi:hypothetical protein
MATRFLQAAVHADEWCSVPSNAARIAAAERSMSSTVVDQFRARSRVTVRLKADTTYKRNVP